MSNFSSLLASVSASIHPVVVLVLCILAGIGTLLLLPGKREITFRRMGGALLALVGLLLPTLIFWPDRSQPLGAYFWIFSGIALVASVRVVTHQRPIYSALYFVLTVFATAGLFILMYAEFMAAALVIIYAGAILITYVFVIMLAASAAVPEGKPASSVLAEYDTASREPFVACCMGFALMGMLLFVIFDKAGGLPAPRPQPGVVLSNPQSIHGSVQSLGAYLFENQMVSVELAGVILAVAMVGAIVISRRRVPLGRDDAFTPPDIISAKLAPLDDSPAGIPVSGRENLRQKTDPEK